MVPAEFADADAGDVERLHHNLVAAFRDDLDEPGDLAFLTNRLRQAVAVGPELEGDAQIERHSPTPVRLASRSAGTNVAGRVQVDKRGSLLRVPCLRIKGRSLHLKGRQTSVV